MARWAKLSERVGQDGKLAEVADQSPVAALLFTWSIAAADVYGILPGDPRQYKARVASAMSLTLGEVEEAIALQINAGLVRAYEADGQPLLYLHHYHDHQDVRWSRVGPPEYPLPEDWRIPQELLKWLADGGAAKAKKAAADYGLSSDKAAYSRTTPGPLPDHSRLDVDVDVDVDTDTAVVVRTSREDQISEVADDLPPPAEHDDDEYTRIKDAACALMAPMFGKSPDGAIATVEGAMQCHERGQEFVLAAATGLRARYDAGDNVHPRYLATNVLDEIRRAERDEKDPRHKPHAAPGATPLTGWQAEEQRRIEAELQGGVASGQRA